MRDYDAKYYINQSYIEHGVNHFELFDVHGDSLGFQDSDYVLRWNIPNLDSYLVMMGMPEKLFEPAPAKSFLPDDPAERKNIPIGTGVLDYFSAALAEIAKVSKAGNDQHNPGQPLHWSRDKSADHWDTLCRHGMERGTIDKDGQRHSAKMAWRGLALLQQEMEDAGAPVSRGSR